jgi:integrase/recombinase XerD
MKIDGHGKAASLTDEQLDALLAAAPSSRYACLWAIQRWTASRITESLLLRWADVNGCVSFRKSTTKTRATKQVPVSPSLAAALATYRLAWEAEHGHAPGPQEALFPAAGSTTSPMSRQAADKALRATCKRVGLEGATTHSFRRSLAQSAVNRGVPLHHIQAVTGHKSLGSLGEYLSATEADVLNAIGG